MARISANLPAEDFELLKVLAQRLGITMTDVIRRGIRTEKWFLELEDNDATLLVEEKDGKVSKVLIKS